MVRLSYTGHTRARAIWQTVDSCTGQDSWTEPGSLGPISVRVTACSVRSLSQSFLLPRFTYLSVWVGPRDPQGQL